MATIAVFDLDKTLCRQDTFLAFLLFMLRRHPARWVRLPVLSLAALVYGAGLRDNSWIKAVFLRQILGGMPQDHVAAESDRLLHAAIRPRITESGLAEMTVCRQRGDIVVLATASPDIYVSRLAAMLDIEHVVCTQLELAADGRLTGRLLGGNCYGAAKLARVDEFRRARGVAWADVTCYSDHVSDLTLMLQAGQAYAVNPDKKFADECRRKNIPILRWI